MGRLYADIIRVNNMNSPENIMTKTSNSPSRLAWWIWGLAAAFYFTDYMARVAPSVMHRNLQIDFGMNEVGFATLTASFYIPYVAMQIPVGILVDRFSVRTLLTLMACITAIGCCLFGLADSLFIASMARVLIGFSAAFAFVSALRLATFWFPAAWLGLLAGLTQAVGMLGASAGQAPLSFLVSAIGWRFSMLLIAGLFIILAYLLYRNIQDQPQHGDCTAHLTRGTESVNIMHGLGVILKHRQTWMNAVYAGLLYAPTAVIGESMGPAYLQYGRGLSVHAAAFSIGLIFIGWVIGGPLVGWWSDRIGRRKPFMIASAIAGMVIMTFFVFYPHMDRNYAYLLCFLYGLTNTGVAIAYAVSTELHDRLVVGTAIAFTNMMSILIGAVMQPLVAHFMDLVSGGRAYDVKDLSLSDFQSGLFLLPVSSLLALLLALMIKETHAKAFIVRHT